MKMNKNTKMYLGIGVTALVIYYIWTNRSKFGGAVDVQTPLGGVSGQVGGGMGVSLATNAPMASSNILPDGMILEQAV
jgi:hypothetical protein